MRLVAWARAVKSRRRNRVPPLWLFTDAALMPDLVGVVRALPAGLCGVVFRHDGVAGRAALGRRVVQACRARRLWVVSAGAAVPGAGRHLRGGWGPGGGRGVVTASAHGPAELVRARRAGAGAVFLSPVFPTLSHAGAAGMGPVRWAGMARASGRGGPAVLALGGIEGARVRRLPGWAAGAGAIRALLD